MELTIACCLWGEFPDAGWSEEYVRRLYHGVCRNLSSAFRFVCFSDRQIYVDGIEVRPLEPPPWAIDNLRKTYIYSPEAGLSGRVILFDLDNIIVGSLDDMAAYSGPLCVRGRLAKVRPRLPDGDMISFHASEVGHLWQLAQNEKFCRRTQGREREFIRHAAPKCDQWQAVCPGQVVSYRYDCRNKGLPPNARVVSCHGLPRPHELTEDWAKEHWR